MTTSRHTVHRRSCVWPASVPKSRYDSVLYKQLPSPEALGKEMEAGWSWMCCTKWGASWKMWPRLLLLYCGSGGGCVWWLQAKGWKSAGGALKFCRTKMANLYMCPSS